MILRFLMALLLIPSVWLGLGSDKKLLLGSSSTTAGVEKCVGWSNTDCEPDQMGGNTVYISADRTYHRPTWTATENGEVISVIIAVSNGISPPDDFRGAVMKYNSGTSTWEPLCSGSYAGSYTANSWREIDTDTGTCTFSTGDDLRFGGDVDIGAANFSMRRIDTGGGGLYYLSSFNDPIANIPDASYSVSSGRDMSIMMKYETIE